THWVLVVMDQFTRRIVGFGVHAGVVDGGAACCMFNRAVRGQASPTPGRMSQRSTTTDGKRIAADSIRRRSRRDIWTAAKTLASESPRIVRHPPGGRYGKTEECFSSTSSACHRDSVDDDSGFSDKNMERFREGH